MNRTHLHTLFSGLELLGKYSVCNIVECRTDWIRVGDIDFARNVGAFWMGPYLAFGRFYFTLPLK